MFEIYRLHLSGVFGYEIARRYSLSESRISEIIKRARKLATLVLDDDGIASQRTDSAVRIDGALARVNAVIEAMAGILAEDHFKASGDDGGGVVPDLWPKFMAADRINAAAKTVATLEKRRADLLGLDSPIKKEITTDGGLRYEIVGVPIEEITGEAASSE